MPTTKPPAVDPLAQEMPSDNTKLRWQQPDTAKLSDGNVVALAHVQLPVDDLCDLLFSPQSSFAVSCVLRADPYRHLDTARGFTPTYRGHA